MASLEDSPMTARAGDVVAVLGGVGAGPTLLRDAALVDEVDDQLHLVAGSK